MISERAIKIQLKMRNSHTTVIAVYAPTEVDEESESENFYEVLQDQIDKVNKKHFNSVGKFQRSCRPKYHRIPTPWYSQH